MHNLYNYLIELQVPHNEFGVTYLLYKYRIERLKLQIDQGSVDEHL